MDLFDLLPSDAAEEQTNPIFKAGYDQCITDVIDHLTNIENAVKLTKSVVLNLPRKNQMDQNNNDFTTKGVANQASSKQKHSIKKEGFEEFCREKPNFEYSGSKGRTYRRHNGASHSSSSPKYQYNQLDQHEETINLSRGTLCSRRDEEDPLDISKLSGSHQTRVRDCHVQTDDKDEEMEYDINGNESNFDPKSHYRVEYPNPALANSVNTSIGRSIASFNSSSCSNLVNSSMDSKATVVENDSSTSGESGKEVVVCHESIVKPDNITYSHQKYPRTSRNSNDYSREIDKLGKCVPMTGFISRLEDAKDMNASVDVCNINKDQSYSPPAFHEGYSFTTLKNVLSEEVAHIDNTMKCKSPHFLKPNFTTDADRKTPDNISTDLPDVHIDTPFPENDLIKQPGRNSYKRSHSKTLITETTPKHPRINFDL